MQQAEASDDEDVPCCFICNDDDNTHHDNRIVPMPCACKKLFVHERCLVRWVRTVKHNWCVVCQTPHRNVSISYTPRWGLNVVSCYAWTVVVFAVGLWGATGSIASSTGAGREYAYVCGCFALLLSLWLAIVLRHTGFRDMRSLFVQTWDVSNVTFVIV
jgi:hypothetical protein